MRDLISPQLCHWKSLCPALPEHTVLTNLPATPPSDPWCQGKEELLAGQTFIYLFTSISLLPSINPLVELSQKLLPKTNSCLWEFWHLSFPSQCCPKILGATCNLFQDNSRKGKSLTFTLFIPIFNSLALQTFHVVSDQRLTQAEGKQNHPESSSLHCNSLWRNSGFVLPGSHLKIPNFKRKLIEGAGQEKEQPRKL